QCGAHAGSAFSGRLAEEPWAANPAVLPRHRCAAATSLLWRQPAKRGGFPPAWLHVWSAASSGGAWAADHAEALATSSQLAPGVAVVPRRRGVRMANSAASSGREQPIHRLQAHLGPPA